MSIPKLVPVLVVALASIGSLGMLGCETSPRNFSSTTSSPVAAIAASSMTAHTQPTDPTLEITLANNQGEYLLVAEAVDPLNDVVTYSGTFETAELDIEMAPIVTDFSISFNNSGNTHYALAVNTNTNDAYSMQFDYDGDETTVVVRTVQGVVLANATATGNWEVNYPPTEGTNLIGVLAIVVLEAATPCEPKFTDALKAASTHCGSVGIAKFSWTCNPDTGAVSTSFECKSSS